MAKKKRAYTYIAWREGGYWNVHSPDLPGVYGWARTFPAARREFEAAAREMIRYLREVGKPIPRGGRPARLGDVTIEVG